METLPKADFGELQRTGLAVITGVIDPLTVQARDGRTIRLSGIESPDLHVEPTGEYAVLAHKILSDLLIGETVTLYQTKNKDRGRINRMGHHLAHLERQSDKAWVQGALISLGVVRVKTTAWNREMAEKMYLLEDLARAQNLGLWKDQSFAIRQADEVSALNTMLHRRMVIEGTVESVSLNNNRIFINFGKNWRNDFTASIAPGDKRLFRKSGLDPMQWGGKRLRVRGWMRNYNGPYIEIDHPEAIEILSDNTSG